MDLLVVSLDSLRLDHAPGAGVDAPRFERVSAGFAFSRRCFSVSSATRPVHMSLVTGLYPFEHGIQGQHHSRARRGAPRLFRALADAGYRVGLFSEAPAIFGGLDLGAPMEALDPAPAAGMAQLRSWMGAAPTSGRCLFVHYWSAHTPYGAADGRALGETVRLLQTGGGALVRARYRRAVTGLFQDKVAPLLEAVDLGRWAVVVFGDHGQSWTQDELYHGRTLRNSVLRVPLWLHAPLTGNRALGGDGLVSLVDLYPTLARLLGLPIAAGTRGRDLLGGSARDQRPPCYLAEIHPVQHAGGAGDPGSTGSGAVCEGAAPERRWCVFDEGYKLLAVEEERGPIRLELVVTWTEEGVSAARFDELAAPYARAYHDLRATSPWADVPLEADPMEGEEERLLRRRLRALGYLE